MQSKNNQDGFTLIELMIVIAIIGILAAIAVPQYQAYLLRAKFSEVISSTTNWKVAVENCISDNITLTTAGAAISGCQNGNATGEVPAAAGAAGNVTSVVTVSNGTITATAISASGLSGQNYILVPTLNAAGAATLATWKVSTTSTCVTQGLC